MLLELIVPPKCPAFASREAQRGRTRWDSHAKRAACRGQGRDGHGLAKFAVNRQLVQHVAERFGVHQAMFDGDFQEAPVFEARESWVVRAGSANRSVQLFTE